MINPTSSSTGDSNRSSSNQTARPRDNASELLGRANEAVSDAVSKVAEVAQDAGQQAKEHVSSLAADAKAKGKEYLNQQVSSGADMARNVATSFKRAADDLDPNAPQVANFVRGAADRLTSFSDEMKDQSVDDLVRRASDFTRQQPLVVFGLASLTGFFLFRALKAKPDHSSASSELSRPQGSHERMGSSYGS
jgi:ElaB/YqjD/DUF883 family membrane-anchored ribosome-binding protein